MCSPELVAVTISLTASQSISHLRCTSLKPDLSLNVDSDLDSNSNSDSDLDLDSHAEEAMIEDLVADPPNNNRYIYLAVLW